MNIQKVKAAWSLHENGGNKKILRCCCIKAVEYYVVVVLKLFNITLV